MSRETFTMPQPLYQYLLESSLRETALLRELREEFANHPQASMQIAPEQGQLMAFITQLMGVKKALEIGVFSGYSALSVAQAMPNDGLLIGCDLSEEIVAVARRYFRRAGLEQRIQLRFGPALDTIRELLNEGHAGSFDFCFIDADKENLAGYYEGCLKLLRRGGVAAVDNVLWKGKVAEPQVDDEDTKTIREFNRRLHADERIDLTMLPIADGLTLARKL